MARTCIEIGTGLSLQFDMVPAISHALYHCGIPVVSRVQVSNGAKTGSPPFSLSFHIPGYSNPWVNEIGALATGRHSALGGALYLDLQDKFLFELQSSARLTSVLQVRIDERLVHEEEVQLRGAAEWSFDPCCRVVLAAYVQPGSPAVQEIVSRAIRRLSENGVVYSCQEVLAEKSRAKLALIECVYNSILELPIFYDLQPPLYAEGFQKILTPEEILGEPSFSKGRGTCIDLALLLASCLENLHLQPAIIMRKSSQDEVWHALLGCWLYTARRYEPVITEYRRIEEAVRSGRMFLLEATGLTANRNLTFGDSLKEAGEGLTEGSFVFALDISAVRRTIVPMHFPMDGTCLAVIRDAEILARSEGSPDLAPRHLFLAIIRNENKTGIVRNLLDQVGARPEWAEDTPDRGKGPSISGRTAAYRRCLDDAASLGGSAHLVGEEHLLYGILISDDPEVDSLLHRMGANRVRLLGALRNVLLKYRDDSAKTLETRIERENRAPIPTVRVIVADDEGQVLIIRRKAKRQFYGNWCLPGGNVEYGETVEEAAVRKLAEETSLGCRSLEHLFYQDSPPLEPNGMHCINFYVRADATGILKLNDEADDHAWIGPEDLRHFRIAFRNDTGLERYWRSCLDKKES